ncbi:MULTISPECIES: hypothetical protein [Arthrobacter]|uniref:Antitoxin VbhA domain-containing protein n=2 Tax=Arthrobacter TaxID=1663 RepID=A0ABU9KPY4_9MICC|nr:hypothetical protein [Arthrobacter sp. YJM1]MDP5227956.1 hypothetical protein [Arthrobacter sp. YJM1]
MSFDKSMIVRSDNVAARRESMTDILASWDLEGAMPDVVGMKIVNRYVSGLVELPTALEAVRNRASQLRAKEISAGNV